MKDVRLQLRVGLVIVAVLVLLVWTIPNFGDESPEPVELVWLLHSNAEKVSEMERAPEHIAALAPATAFDCGAKDLDIYLAVNGLQSVYWTEPLEITLEECVKDKASTNLVMVRNRQFGPPFKPPYMENYIH